MELELFKSIGVETVIILLVVVNFYLTDYRYGNNFRDGRYCIFDIQAKFIFITIITACMLV